LLSDIRALEWVILEGVKNLCFERRPETIEAWIDLSMFSMMSNRLESLEKNNKKHAERAA